MNHLKFLINLSGCLSFLRVFSAMGASWRMEALLLPFFFLGWDGGLGM